MKLFVLYRMKLWVNGGKFWGWMLMLAKDGSSINIVEEGIELVGLIGEAAVIHENIPALAGSPSHLWGDADGRGGMLKVG